ncbi:MAG: D-alanyl-D-alanine carboxypeptidase [Erythrobacter sp.]|nr:D-alanyl-D-alanine carboxypeptidase [Erythrobacter sp.]
MLWGIASPAAATREAPVDPAIPIVLLVDVSSGQTLYARAPDRRFVPASVTKVMTAYTAFELFKQGKISPEQSFVFSDSAAEKWQRTGSTMFLEAGDEASVDQLLMAITTVSANDGSIALAEGAAGSVAGWVTMMNANASALGMRQSQFGTPNGWPDDGRTFTTARDLVRLGRALVTEHPRRFAQYFGHRGLVTNGVAQDNHEPLTGRVEGADGIKTGYTNQAGYTFLGTAKRGGRRLLLVLAGAPDERMRDRSARAMIEWGFNAFDVKPLFSTAEMVARAQVQDGNLPAVPLLAENPIHVAIPTDARSRVTLAIRYEGPLRAPVKMGEQVAQLQINVDGMPPSLIPLVAGEDVEKAGFFRRIANAFAGLFA